jgi:flavorubredoxin
METNIDEIAPDVFRLSTWIDQIAPPAGFTFNQFLVRGDEPFLFHTGMRQLFPLVSSAIERLVPLSDLRWISFAHVEADENGAMNLLLDAAPDSQVVHGELANMLSLNDMANRAPRGMGNGETLDIGGHVLRFLPTPHVPHNWESGLWFDESTNTLFAGDLFTQVGGGPALVDSDLVEAAVSAENLFRSTALTTDLAPTLHRLADLGPSTLALMHGPSFRGDGAVQLRRLAESYSALATPTVA